MSAPHGHCQCGCGQKTSLAAKTSTKRGLVKGQPIAYIHGHNRRKYPAAEAEQRRAEYTATYYRTNKEKIAAREAKRYIAKRDELLLRNGAYKSQWTRSPKGKDICKREIRRRKARRRDAFVEDIDRDAVFLRDGGRCGICQQLVDPENWDLDHIVPLGPGTETYDNVRVACQRCNRAKGAEDKRLLAEWRTLLPD